MSGISGKATVLLASVLLLAASLAAAQQKPPAPPAKGAAAPEEDQGIIASGGCRVDMLDSDKSYGTQVRDGGTIHVRTGGRDKVLRCTDGAWACPPTTGPSLTDRNPC